MERIIIAGKRIQLKEIIKPDLQILLGWRNSYIFQSTCLSHIKNCTLEELNAEIENAYRYDRFAHFIAWNTLGLPIGTCWIYRHDSVNGYCFITVFIADEYRNFAFYGVEIFVLVCDYVFRLLKMRKVYCEVHSDNNYSRSIFEHLNIDIEGRYKRHTLLPNGLFSDLLIYAFYKEKFEVEPLAQRFLI